MAAANAIDHFSYYQKIDALKDIPDYIFHAYLVGAILIVLSILAYGKLRNPRKNLLPESKLSIATLFELATEFVLNLMKGLLGEDAKKHLPLVGSIFIFIFFCNAMGLIPGFQPATISLNTNLAISITVFIYFIVMGFKEHGMNYLKHFLGPVWWLGPLVFVIEMIGQFVRPISLSLRLGGNMMGDHVVLGIFSGLTPLIVPVIFLALGLFVCFIQAFVFSLLSVIYISLATAHEH